MTIPAIIYINTDPNSSDLNQTTKDTLVSQLFLDEVISGQEFDDRVVADPNYPEIIHLNGLRVMVIREDIFVNKELADVILFFKYGMVSIEKGNIGAPGLTLPISKLYIEELLRYNNSKYTVNIPDNPPPYPCQHQLHGIFSYGTDVSGVHCPNPDNEQHNQDFLNRK